MQGTEKFTAMQNISCMYKVNCAWVLLREVIVLHMLEYPVHLKCRTKKGTNINLSTTNSQTKQGYFGNYLMICFVMMMVSKGIFYSITPFNTPLSAL